MDAVSTALTNAWLAAVARVQSQQSEPPEPGPAKTLTDVIERALRSGGLSAEISPAAGADGPGKVIDRVA